MMQRVHALIGIGVSWLGLQGNAIAFNPQQWIANLDSCQGYRGHCLMVDLSDRQVMLYKAGHKTTAYPIAIGKTGWETPIGNHYVFEMGRNVQWLDLYTGEPSPINPMLGAWIGYVRYDNEIRVGFHPTPARNTVGQATSHGCNRMKLEDFNQLYEFIEQAPSLVPVLVRT